MGYDGKYGTITTEYGDIPDDEPVILFRARDNRTGLLLAYYRALCESEGSPQRHLNLIEGTRRRFLDWQEANRDKVRVPDSERSQEWMGDRMSVRD